MPELSSREKNVDVRPSAMTLAMNASLLSAPSGARWLRWALAREGRIVREGKLAPEGTLSGGSEGDVPTDAARPIAWFEEGAWRLALDAGWDVRIEGQKGAPRTLDGWTERTLADDARVRVVLGDLTLLVQVIEMPPKRAKPALPPALSGGWLARTDWAFTAFVAGSFVLHFAFIAAVIEADFPVEVGIPERAVRLIMEPSVPPPMDAPRDRMVARDDARDDTPSAEDGSHGDPDQADSHRDPAPRRPMNAHRGGPSRGDRPSLDPNAIAREANAEVQRALGAVLGGPDSALQGLIRDGDVRARAGDVMADVTAPAMAANGGEPRLGERTGAPVPGGDRLGQLRTRPRGNGPMQEGEVIVERTVRVQPPRMPIIDDPPPPDFDMRELVRALRMRMTAIQRCYEHDLTHANPDTAGRITIALRVMPVGTLDSVHAAENETGSEALAACTVRVIRTIRLRVGPSEPVEARYPIVFSR